MALTEKIVRSFENIVGQYRSRVAELTLKNEQKIDMILQLQQALKETEERERGNLQEQRPN